MKKWINYIMISAFVLVVCLSFPAFAAKSASGILTVENEKDVSVTLSLPEGETETITSLRLCMYVTVKQGSMDTPEFEFDKNIQTAVKDADISKDGEKNYKIDLILSGKKNQVIFNKTEKLSLGVLHLNPGEGNFEADIEIIGENGDIDGSPAIQYMDASGLSPMKIDLTDIEPVTLKKDCEHHYEVTETTKPSCMRPGSETSVCSLCGDTQKKELPATKKIDTCQLELSEKTFDYDGNKKEPKVIVKDEEDVVPENSYTISYENNIEIGKAKVVVTGANGYTGKLEQEFEIVLKEHDHVWDEGETTKEATCTEQGELTKHCTQKGCMETLTEKIPALGHDWKEISRTNPTCTKDGEIQYECSRCKETKTEKIAATKDITTCELVLSEMMVEYDGKAKEPKVTLKDGEEIVKDDAYTVSYANNIEIGKAKVTVTGANGYKGVLEQEFEIVLKIHEHEWDEGKIEKEPTCTETGEKVYQCKVIGCTEKKTEVIKALGHDWREISRTNPTCMKEGEIKEECSRCKETRSVKLAATKDITTCEVALSETSFEYDGKEKKPQIILKDGDNEVPEDAYTVSYKDNINVGTATVVIKAANGYTGTKNVTFEITQKADHEHKWDEGKVEKEATCTEVGEKIYHCTIEGCSEEKKEEIPALGHDWKEVERKQPTCMNKGEILEKCTRCQEEQKRELDATKNISTCSITLSEESMSYDGKAKEPEVTIKDGDVEVPAKAYKITYYQNKKIGTATVVVKGVNGYEGSLRAQFHIVVKEHKHDWDDGEVVKEATCAKAGQKNYNCQVAGCNALLVRKLPVLEHNWEEVSKKEPTCLNKGEIVEKCSSCGEKQTRILKATKNLEGCILKTAKTSYVYTGKAITPSVTVYDGKKKVDTSYYKVTYSNHTNVGTATVKVTGKNGYSGSVEGIFNISKASQKISCKTSYSKTYGASAFNLNASAKTKLQYFSDNTNVIKVSSNGKVTVVGCGKAQITISAVETENYNPATKTVTVQVKPKKQKITSLKSNASKSFTVKYTKDTKASGYEVCYATNEKFTKAKKTVKISGSAVTTKTVSKLKAKTNYYVKVRSYKKVGSTYYYGAYSTVKKIRTK